MFITRCTLHSQCYMLSTQLMRASIPSCSIFRCVRCFALALFCSFDVNCTREEEKKFN